MIGILKMTNLVKKYWWLVILIILILFALLRSVPMTKSMFEKYKETEKTKKEIVQLKKSYNKTEEDLKNARKYIDESIDIIKQYEKKINELGKKTPTAPVIRKFTDKQRDALWAKYYIELNPRKD